MHNGLLADPTNPYTMAIKDLVRKGSRKMTVADHQKRDRLEWEGSLYWDETDGPIVPSDCIERCVQIGAQKDRRGKDARAAVFMTETHAKLEYNGPRTKDALWADSRFSLRKGVVVNRGRVIRVRPMIPTGWQLTTTLEFDESIIDDADLRKAVVEAGAREGLGDWRPKFGRFLVEFS